MLSRYLQLAFLGSAVLLHGGNSYTVSAKTTHQGAQDSSAQKVNPVVQWNRELLVIVRTPGAQSPTVHPTRSFAIMHAAIYDAVNAIDGKHWPYLVRLSSVPRDASIAFPERHLGLVQASEQDRLSDLLGRLADLAEQNLDLDAILAMAAPLTAKATTTPVLPPPGQRIALANDAAFGFFYPHLLNGWRAAGAEIVPFSPLADEAPPEDCEACWLPGGYPELHCARLVAASRFRAGMARFAVSRPVYGECGGYMVLGAMLEDASGQQHPMLGLLSHTTSFAKRQLHLGYREATLLADSALGHSGSIVRGHEFHYARTIDPGTDEPLALLSDATGKSLGPTGGRCGNVSGSFFHVIAAMPSTGVSR